MPMVYRAVTRLISTFTRPLFCLVEDSSSVEVQYRFSFYCSPSVDREYFHSLFVRGPARPSCYCYVDCREFDSDCRLSGVLLTAGFFMSTVVSPAHSWFCYVDCRESGSQLILLCRLSWVRLTADFVISLGPPRLSFLLYNHGRVLSCWHLDNRPWFEVLNHPI